MNNRQRGDLRSLRRFAAEVEGQVAKGDIDWATAYFRMHGYAIWVVNT